LFVLTMRLRVVGIALPAFNEQPCSNRAGDSVSSEPCGWHFQRLRGRISHVYDPAKCGSGNRGSRARCMFDHEQRHHGAFAAIGNALSDHADGTGDGLSRQGRRLASAGGTRSGEVGDVTAASSEASERYRRD